ncbi:hypothetical protein N658DRAFT_93516 [Parathielavia hyrcaniae]|uniref:Uncharacterized protein n=1 Tax=Parathielavia hyrcaniae TaxID=113614 RepID=A0AAN6PZJ9_9PEZI|nr:hypothetical protein N658DRAFT_93516 [Parathielavia hyrcaniae]
MRANIALNSLRALLDISKALLPPDHSQFTFERSRCRSLPMDPSFTSRDRQQRTLSTRIFNPLKASFIIVNAYHAISPLHHEVTHRMCVWARQSPQSRSAAPDVHLTASVDRLRRLSALNRRVHARSLQPTRKFDCRAVTTIPLCWVTGHCRTNTHPRCSCRPAGVLANYILSASLCCSLCLSTSLLWLLLYRAPVSLFSDR